MYIAVPSMFYNDACKIVVNFRKVYDGDYENISNKIEWNFLILFEFFINLIIDGAKTNETSPFHLNVTLTRFWWAFPTTNDGADQWQPRSLV